MNICFLYLELPFFVCHHTCYVILPADPNCLPEGCIALAASHHQDTVFLSLELCLQNLERREPVWAIKHLFAAAQGHTATGTLCEPWVCWLHRAPAFPRSAWGPPGTLSCTQVGHLGQPQLQPLTAQMGMSAPQGGHDQSHGCRQEQPSTQSISLLWAVVPTALPTLWKVQQTLVFWASLSDLAIMRIWSHHIAMPVAKRLKICSQLFPRGCLLPPSWQAWLTVQTLLAPVMTKQK